MKIKLLRLRLLNALQTPLNAVIQLLFDILNIRTTISLDVQTLFCVQLAFARFLSRIEGNFLIQCQYHGYSTPPKIFLYSR